jgi:hypothetical protein
MFFFIFPEEQMHDIVAFYDVREQYSRVLNNRNIIITLSRTYQNIMETTYVLHLY